MKPSIPVSSLISKFICANGIDKIYSQVILKHLIAILTAMAIKGFRAKMVDIAESSSSHRTTISHFLCKGKWNDEKLTGLIKDKTWQYMQKRSASTDKPMFISIDDTVNPKSKPSRKALRPIEGAEYHFSHLESKQVWGHQVVVVMVSCADKALNYDLHWYDKTKQTKTEYVRELAASLPVAMANTYVLTDSWYTNPDIIKAFTQKGYSYIGALKTNRIIYPGGERISISDFVLEMLVKSSYNLVTVNGTQYFTFRYEGRLNDIDKAAVIITLPKKGGFDSPHPNPKAINAFLCTDMALSTQTILEYYSERWCIETFFEQEKGALGFGKGNVNFSV